MIEIYHEKSSTICFGTNIEVTSINEIMSKLP